MAAFDHEGFYKTGDYTERIGNDYFFKGRASSDWVQFHEYTISILELERYFMDLPYISEAHVLPVPDREAGWLVAALVEVQKPNATEQDHGILPNKEVPRTTSVKALKTEILRKYFNISGYLPKDYAMDGAEYWGNKLDLTASTRTFDWGGIYQG